MAASYTLGSAVDFKQLATGTNVLHYFRSYTYNFTISCLEAEVFQQELTPERMADVASRIIVAKTGGKGAPGLDLANVKPVTIEQDNQVIVDKTNVEEIDKFNKTSPGRFDFYFGDVDIGTIMNPTERTGYTQATTINFTIIEPFSLGGFLENLMASALAAGHPNFVSAPFCLKLEFQGYPDNSASAQDIPDSVNPGAVATRYFPFRFADIKTTTDDQGTKYVCKAIPINEFGLGDPNKLNATLTISGGAENTVGSALNDMITKVNDAVKKLSELTTRKDANIGKNAHDTYVVDIDPDIAAASLADLQKDETQTDIKNSVENNGVLDNRQANGAGNPKKWNKEFAVSFSNTSNIHDCMAAIVRDSDWSKNILNDFKNRVDASGHIQYFLISIKTEPKPGLWDPVRNKPCYTYTFLVKPYRIHVSTIPSFEGIQTIDPAWLEPEYVRRNYNHLYTGKNKDVIKLEINYDALYFQSMAVYLGNSNSLMRGQGSGISGQTLQAELAQKTTIKKIEQGDGFGAQLGINHNLSDQQGAGEPTRPFQAGNPASVFARTLYNAIQGNVRSKLLEMDILGDPYYLVQDGMGNIQITEDAKNKGISQEDGSVTCNSGNIYVRVNVNSAYDIDRETGLMQMYGASNFSGIYQVRQVQSKFSNGEFRQHLKMMKLPDQPVDTGQQPDTRPIIPEDLVNWEGY